MYARWPTEVRPVRIRMDVAEPSDAGTYGFSLGSKAEQLAGR